MNRTLLILLLLDLVGTLLFAAGLFTLMDFSPTLVPPSLQFPFYEWLLLLLGGAMTLPYILYVLSGRARQQRNKPSDE